MTQTPPALEVFRDFSIVGTASQLDETKARILVAAQDAGPEWRPAREDELRRSSEDDDVITLVRAADDLAPNALVFLLRMDGTYRVTNIVPEKVGHLGRSRYNAILQEFETRFARPAAEAAGARIEATAAEETLEDFLGEAGAKALRGFCSMANMSTGSSHPLDRRRWYDFIAAAEIRDVDSDTLGRWLQALGWDEDSAHRLTSEFEFGSGLLERVRDRG